MSKQTQSLLISHYDQAHRTTTQARAVLASMLVDDSFALLADEVVSELLGLLADQLEQIEKQQAALYELAMGGRDQ